jgi:hypothetical protein
VYFNQRQQRYRIAFMQELLSARDRSRFDLCCSALERLKKEASEFPKRCSTFFLKREIFLNSLETACIKHEKNVLLHRARWISANQDKADQMSEIKEAVDDLVHSDYATRTKKRGALNELMKATFPDEGSRALYIAGLMALPLAPFKLGGTFVATIEGVPPLERCVGYYSLLDVPEGRMHHIHFRGLEKATDIKLMQQTIEGCTKEDSLRVCMANELIDQIYQHGLAKVQCGVNDAASPTFFQSICRKRKLCGRCGGSDHEMARCGATKKAKWAGGAAISN